MPSPTRRVPLGSIAAALYVLSLATPAIVVIHKPLLWGAAYDEPMFGIQCLLIGWITIPGYANPLLGIAALGLALRRPTVAIVSSLGAFVLALTTFPLYLGTELRAPHVGYFAWLASMVLVFVAGCADSRPRLEAPEA